MKVDVEKEQRLHAIRVFRNGGHCGSVTCLRCLYAALAKAA